MIPPAKICASARLARDPRFDGRFFIGVLTTGIFCRPVCPARIPAEDNVRYYATSASAQDAGFRPCLRCRPETARRLPEWTLGSQTVIRGLRMIDAGFLLDHDADALAANLHISARHLNRLFQQELGTTPKSLAKVRRLHLAKRLIDRSQLTFSEVAMQAGYGSVRRFNEEVRKTFGRTPRDLRLIAHPATAALLTLQLPVREPYHHRWVFGFLAQRALPGIEEVTGLVYRRRVSVTDGGENWLQVAWCDGGLTLTLPADCPLELGDVLCRVRRLFDLDADPLVIDEQLAQVAILSEAVRADPGLRVPGAWDGFETAVRAILGQQVSVARATELAGALCTRYGAGDFPTPQQLVRENPAAIGMPGKRGGAITALAKAATDGALVLDESAEPKELTEALCAIPGVGPWTAGYIGMRVARDPDAFPDSDWVVLKMLGATPAGARRQAEAWRPWRAYAVMTLWWRAQLQRAQRDSLSAAQTRRQRKRVTGQTRCRQRSQHSAKAMQRKIQKADPEGR